MFTQPDSVLRKRKEAQRAPTQLLRGHASPALQVCFHCQDFRVSESLKVLLVPFGGLLLGPCPGLQDLGLERPGTQRARAGLGGKGGGEVLGDLEAPGQGQTSALRSVKEKRGKQGDPGPRMRFTQHPELSRAEGFQLLRPLLRSSRLAAQRGRVRANSQAGGCARGLRGADAAARAPRGSVNPGPSLTTPLGPSAN